VPISSTNTRRSASMRPSSSRHRSLKNSSRSSAPLVLFSAVREASKRPADRSLAHRNPAEGEKELGPLRMGSPRPFFEIFYEQLGGLLVQLRSPTGSLAGFERAALVELLTVAFDRGTIDPETAGGLGLGDALFDRLDDLLSEVKRICTHASTIPGAPSSQSAVTIVCCSW
jgi:hypothetical protein